ncbi:kinetochore protein spc25 [Moniliophthora roreri MCA 2997]|uniref:Kinetochore protein SPC25 n=2 Tax=Moniliophthora roreri TaxID=221103 RepID=V2X7G3_MONRO|nr:kinetochore protein spc25 [Moniliophthora roreri MCA 2997]KAI3610711.1 kinetochore protein spc25 [Moniliophthora roreri]
MTHILRLPQIDLASVLASPNPHIDLKLGVYENSTRNFLKAVSNYKNRSIATISELRSRSAAEKKKLMEKAQAVEIETNQCKVKEIELMETLAKEQNEKREAEASVAQFKRELATLNERCTSVDAQIEEYRAIVANLRRERNKERATLNTFAARISPELDACEKRLACVIEGIEKDQFLVRFTRVDRSDPDKEFNFVVDVSNQAYKVRTTSPPLPSLPVLVEYLNTTGDVYGFIIRTRQAFDKLANGED